MSNFGSQSITTNLASEYDPENEGVRQYNIIPYGIYDGLELSIDGPDTVQISGPGVGVIYDEVNNLAIQYQQHDNYVLDVNTTEPYIIARWEYNQSLTNPVRYETDTQSGLASTDVILGKVLFDQNDEVDGFDLSERVERDLEHIEAFDTEADEGALYQSDGSGNVVEVLSNPSDGTLIRWDANNNEWSFGSSDVESLSTSAGTGALYQSDGNGNVVPVVENPSDNQVALFNSTSSEWETYTVDSSNTGNTVVERTSDGSVNAQDVNADGSVSAVTISASDVFQWIQSLDGSNQTFLDLSPGDLNDSWTFDWIASSNQIRITTSAGNTVFLNPDGTIGTDGNTGDPGADDRLVPRGYVDALSGNPTGTNGGNLWSEEVSQTITTKSTETVNIQQVNGLTEGVISKVFEPLSTTGDNWMQYQGTTTNGNGNLNGVDIYNDDDQDNQVTIRFFGVVE